jgi:antitoxin (DNA-binding transcriptional repressor) of toxin-antitoxin stability system
MREIELKDAEALLSSLIDDAAQGESSTITRDGKRAAVSAKDVPPRNRKSRRGRRTNPS